MKRVVATFFVLSLFTIACQNPEAENALVNLQKRAALAQSDTEDAAILGDLLDYYANKTTPDSVVARVADELKKNQETFLESKEQEAHHSQQTNGRDQTEPSNPYTLERSVETNFRKALIAKSLGREEDYERLLATCTQDASLITELGGSGYWRAFLNDSLNRHSFDELNWLKAEIAKTLCQGFSKSDPRFAQELGAYGLRLLNQIGDVRLRSNLLSKLQVSLHFGDFHDLSILLYGEAIKPAKESDFYIIQNGSILFRGYALSKIGKKNDARQAFHESIDLAQKYSSVPSMDYFARVARTGLLDLLIEVGEYQDALRLSYELKEKNFHFYAEEKILLNLALGRLYKSLGNYALADSHYTKSLELAEQEKDWDNKAVALHNLGTLYSALKDYDEALIYAHKADSLLNATLANHYARRVLVSTGLAEIYAAKGDVKPFQAEIDRTMRFIQNIAQPIEKAYALDAIGQASLMQGDHERAAKNFDQAIAIYNEFGADRRALSAAIKRGESLLNGEALSTAESAIERSLQIAKKMKDQERVIDALALKANLRNKQNQPAAAVNVSNEFIAEIEGLGAETSRFKLQLLYRQKFYHYLKSAAVYALRNNDETQALGKLNNAKSSMMRARLSSSNEHSFQELSLDTIFQNLGQKALAVDFLISSDSLFAFTLFQNRLKVFQKHIDLNTFASKVDSFKSEIQSSPESNLIAVRYKTVSRLGAELGDTLFGWPELQAALETAETTYIIPDQFLYDLPFAALQHDKNNDDTFLVNMTALAVAPNISSLQNSKHASAPLTEKDILLSVDQSFRAAGAFLKRTQDQFPKAEELRSNSLRAQKHLLLEQLNQKRAAHIYVGHGMIDEAFPENSMIGVSYANERTSRRDTMNLSLKDLEAVNWQGVDLVFLVGCETARGKFYLAFGALGAQQKLLSEGASAVVGNLWKIDANYAIPQTGDVLSHLKSTQNIAVALRKVQLEAIHSIRSDPFIKYPLPYFWANHVISTTSIF